MLEYLNIYQQPNDCVDAYCVVCVFYWSQRFYGTNGLGIRDNYWLFIESPVWQLTSGQSHVTSLLQFTYV